MHTAIAISTMVTSMPEVRQVLLILPGPSLSLHGLPVISHRHFLIVSISDKECPTAATAGDCKSSSRKHKEDSTYSYLLKIITPNNKKRATVHEMYDVERRFDLLMLLKSRSCIC